MVNVAVVVDEPDLSNATRLINWIPPLTLAIWIVPGTQTVTLVAAHTVSLAEYAVVLAVRVMTDPGTFVKYLPIVTVGA